jgi:hypothetical protein
VRAESEVTYPAAIGLMGFFIRKNPASLKLTGHAYSDSVLVVTHSIRKHG